MITLFESPLALIDAAKGATKETEEALRQWESGDSWAGQSAGTLTALAAQGGNENNVPAALKLLQEMEAVLPDTERAEWLPSVVGGFACVPDAIQGLPECMRQKTIMPNNGAPIKLGIIVTVSTGCSDRAILNRGLAMLAILMQLTTAGRPVELWIVSILNRPSDKDGESVIATRVCNGVVSLAEADMLLCNRGFARRIPFTVQFGLHKSDGGWPDKFNYQDGGVEYAAALAKRMGFQMILPSLTNAEEQSVKADPAKWMLAKYNAIQAIIDGEA